MKKIALIAVLGLSFLTSLPAHAEGNWRKHHPWRAGDNSRLRRQNRRINQGVRDGQLTHSEAQTLRQNDRNIRQEERDMASGNKGHHLTPAEQKTLNQQLNQNSGAIHTERHD